MESFDYSFCLYCSVCLCFCYHIVISVDNSSAVSYEKYTHIIPELRRMFKRKNAVYGNILKGLFR